MNTTFSRVCRTWIAALGICASLAIPARGEEVLVFAAASLKSALDDIAAEYSAQSGHTITLSFAGSSVLARQIQLGAPAQVFLSANVAWMDLLEVEGFIDPETRVDLLGNSLVLIGPPTGEPPVEIGPDYPLGDQLAGGHLAMALVDAVPAGVYGKAALQYLGLWDGVADRIAQSDNVRAALALVAVGAAPLGVVYATDAAADDRVQVLGHFPAASHPQIVYPAAVTAKCSDAARRFLAYLRRDEARRIFVAQGFALLEG